MVNSKYKNNLKKINSTTLSFILNDFSKGMVDDIISKSVSENSNYAYDLKNFILDKKGKLYKRPGTELTVNGELAERYNLNFNNQKTQGTLFHNDIIYGVYNGVIYQLNHLIVKPLTYYEYYENNVLDADTNNIVINNKLLQPGYYVEHKPFLDNYFTKNEEYVSLDGDATSFAFKDDFVYWIVGQKFIYKPLNNKYWKLDINGDFILSQQTGQPILTDVLNVNYQDKCQSFLEVPAKRIEYSSFNNLGPNEYAKNPTHRVSYYKDFSNSSVIENLNVSLINDDFFGKTQSGTIISIKNNIFSGAINSPYFYNYSTHTGDEIIWEHDKYWGEAIGNINYDFENVLYSVWLKNTVINLTFTDGNGDIVNQNESFWLGDFKNIYFDSFISNPHNSAANGSNFYFRYFLDATISSKDVGPYYFTFNLLGEMREYPIDDFDTNTTRVYQGYENYSSDFFLEALIPVNFEQDRDSSSDRGTRVVQMYAGVNANVTETNQINYPTSSEINLNDTTQVHKILDSANNYNEQGIIFNENDLVAINNYDNNIKCQINISGSFDGTRYDGNIDETTYNVDVSVDGIYYRDDFKYNCNLSTGYGFQKTYDNVFQFLNDAISNGYSAKLMYLNLGDIFYEFKAANELNVDNIYLWLVFRHFGYNKDVDTNTIFETTDYDYSNSGTYYLELPVLTYESLNLYGNNEHQFDGTNKGTYDDVFIDFIPASGVIRWDIIEDKVIRNVRESINYSFIFPSSISGGKTIYDFQNLIDFFGEDNWINNKFDIYYKKDTDTDYSLIDFNTEQMIQIKEILERQNPTTVDYSEDEQWTLVEPPQFIFAYYQTNVVKDGETVTSTPHFGVYNYFLYIDEKVPNAYTDINFELAGIVPNQYPITTGKPTIFYGCVADLQTGLEENTLGAYTKYYQWKLYRAEDILDTTIIEPDLETKDQWKTGFDATRQKIVLANSTGYILYLFAMKELDYESWIETNENTIPDIGNIQFVSYEFLPQDLLPDITVDDYSLLTSSGALKINNGILNYKDQALIYGKDKIYVSLLNNFNYFPFSFVMTLSNNFGSLDVKSLKYIQKSLIVLTNKSLYNLSGDDPTDFSLSLINADYGLISKNANSAIDVGLGFLSTQGIVKLTNYAWGTKANLNIEYIGKNIQNRIYELLENAENYQYSSATLYLNYFVINIWDLKNDKYYLYFYDDFNKSWFRWESKYFDLLNMYIYNGDLYLIRKNNLEILKVGYRTLYEGFLEKNGYIDRHSRININKSADTVETLFESPLLKFDYDDYRKKYKRLNLYLNAGNIPSNFDILVYNENGILLNEDFEIRETDKYTLDVFPKNGTNKIGSINVKNYFDIGYYDVSNFYQEDNQKFNLIEESYNLTGSKGLFLKYIIKHKDDADFGLDYVTVDLKVKKSN